MVRRSLAGYSLVELCILTVCFAIFVSMFVAGKLVAEPPALTHYRPSEELDVERIRFSLEAYAEQSRSVGREPVFPMHLDMAPVGAEADSDGLFTDLIPEGLRGSWRKVGMNVYTFKSNDSGPDATNSYLYQPKSGRFVKTDMRSGRPA